MTFSINNTWSAKAVSGLAMLALVASMFAAVVPHVALGATTGTLQTVANGTYTSWTGDESDVDETSNFSCSSNDYILSTGNNNRESFTVSLSSVPNGATITSVAVTVRDRGDNSSGGTYKTFARLNGTNVDASANLTATGNSGACSSTKTQTLDVADTVKSGATTLEIGVVKVSGNNNAVRVGTITATVTYTEATPTDVCSNLDGNQASVPEGYTEVGGICTEDEPTQGEACTALRIFLDIDSCDTEIIETAICPIIETNPGSLSIFGWAFGLLGINIETIDCDDDDQGGGNNPPTCPEGQTGTPPNCTTPEPETCPEGETGTPPNCTPTSGGDEGGNEGNETDDTPAPKVAKGGGGGSSIVYCSATRTTFCKERPGGEVLGASTDNMCSPLITTYLGTGKANNMGEIAKLQNFLNNHMGAGLAIDGVFGEATKAAVNAFQLKYGTEVLAPWIPHGHPSAEIPTGIVYKTTQWMINKLNCSTLNAPMPILP